MAFPWPQIQGRASDGEHVAQGEAREGRQLAGELRRAEKVAGTVEGDL